MTRFARSLAAALAACVASPLALAQTAPEPTPAEPVTPAVEAEAPPPPPKKKGIPISGAYDGGVVLKTDDGNFELKINGLLQSRFELVNRPTPTDDDPDDTTTDSRFQITRARVGMSGYVWKNTQFKVEYSFSDAGNSRLRDFYVNQVLFGGMLHVRAGQMKKPFNRNEIVSDFGTEFLEKAITNTFGSRDIGVAIHNGYDRSPDGLEWVIGIWNGQGDTTVYPVSCTIPAGQTNPVCTVGTPTNTPTGNFRPEAEVRVGYNHGGIKGYSEGDFEGGPLRFAVAANARFRNIQDLDSRPFAWDLGIDAVVKIMGLDVWAAAFLTKNKENLSQTVLDTRDDDPQFAFHVQAGYMILPKTLQVAARFARFPESTPAEGTDLEYNQEARFALGYFFSKSHSYKWTTDFGFVKSTTEDSDPTWLFRSGVVYIF